MVEHEKAATARCPATGNPQIRGRGPRERDILGAHGSAREPVGRLQPAANGRGAGTHHGA